MIEHAHFGSDSHLANIKYKKKQTNMFGCIWTHEKSRTPVPIIMSVLTRIRIQKISLSFLMCCIIWSSAWDAQCERKELAINLKSVCVCLSSVHVPNKLNLRRQREYIRGL